MQGSTNVHPSRGTRSTLRRSNQRDFIVANPAFDPSPDSSIPISPTGLRDLNQQFSN